jgi:hypothetical protein
MRRAPLVSVLSLALVVALGACQRAEAPAAASSATSASNVAPENAVAWQAAIDEFVDGYFQHNPADAANAGKHEYDGKLPDWSSKGLADYGAWLHSQRDRLAGFGDDQLDAGLRFQREYALAVIDNRLFWLEDADFPHHNPAFYTDTISPSLYLTREYAPLAQRMAAFIQYEENLPAATAQIEANMHTPMAASLIDYGIGVYGGLADFFKNDVPKAFASVEDKTLQDRFAAANAGAIQATSDLADWLKSQKATSTQDFVLGPERYARMLKATERVDMPVDQLKAIGESDLKRNLDALKLACEQFAPGASESQCIAKADADKPEGGAVEGARKQLAGLRQFIVDKDLVTIPGTEAAKVDEAPPFNRANFAYIEIPGPYEVGLPSIYYIAPPDPTWPKAEQLAYVPGKSSLLFTSSHEVWPGHFLQFLHANRSSWKFAQLFVGYAYAEGWAHYCEEMMWDAGLGNGDPEAHIGQLQEALLRNVRFLSSIGMHTGGMTMAESERMFREQAFQDPGNARQQAARGTYDPAYLNYTLGKLMIKQLREDWTASRGGRKAWKAFHDQFLSYGGPPIPLVRAQMMGGAVETKLWTQPAAAPSP